MSSGPPALELPDSRKKQKLGTLSCVSLITNKMIGTGLFSTPSIIFKYCGGNVTLYLALWLIGALIIFSGLLVYLEFALNSPLKNGGEKNYLLRVFNRPKGLTGCMYAFQMVFLGFSSGNAFAFGKYIWFAISGEQVGQDNWTSKLIGVFCISFCILLHIWHPARATSVFNFLGVFKLVILLLIIFIGLLAGLGVVDVHSASAPQVISPSSGHTDVYSVSVALLQIIYSFKGWENANYVLLEIEDPYHILTVAAPLAVLLVTLMSFLVVVSYLIVIPKDELLSSGVLVAGIFFNKVFGESITSKILPLLIALLTLGNVMVVSYAHSIVNQELANNNYLPFSKKFQNINYSLMLHWLVSVVILVAPPSSEIYEFVVNLYVYPGTWINVFITAGLVYLRMNARKEGWGRIQQLESSSPDQESASFADRLSHEDNNEYTEFNLLMSQMGNGMMKTYTVPWVCIGLFLLANIFLALFPFVPPPSSSNTGSIPYWCFPVVGTGCLLMGGVFFYTRRYYYTKTLQRVPLYEEDYKPEI